MEKKLLNNWGLKMLSVILAILTWIIVIFLVDPVVESDPYDVTVKVKNQNKVTDIDKVFTVLDKSTNIKVTLTGKRSTIGTIKNEDIIATADMLELLKWQSDISEQDTQAITGTIPIRIECKGITAGNISASSQTVKVSIENKSSSEFVVNVSTNNTSPASGNAVGTLTSSVKTVTISGAESLITKIQKVEAEVDVTNLTEDKEFENVALNIYDRNGDKLTETQLGNLDFSTSSRTPYVNVSMKLWEVRNVKLKVTASGTPAAGFRCTSVGVTPAEISIAGTKEALKGLKEQGDVINIKQTISVQDAQGDVEDTINITEYLPENTKLANDVSEFIFVTAKISPISSKIMDIPISEISVIGLADGYFLNFEKAGSVKVELKGLKEDLAKLEKAGIESKDIKVEVNLSGYSAAGTYSVSLVSSLTASFKDRLTSNGVTLPNIEIPEVKISVILEKKAAEATATENTDKESNSQ